MSDLGKHIPDTGACCECVQRHKARIAELEATVRSAVATGAGLYDAVLDYQRHIGEAGKTTKAVTAYHRLCVAMSLFEEVEQTYAYESERSHE
jgi:hypothetical protein